MAGSDRLVDWMMTESMNPAQAAAKKTIAQSAIKYPSEVLDAQIKLFTKLISNAKALNSGPAVRQFTQQLETTKLAKYLKDIGWADKTARIVALGKSLRDIDAGRVARGAVSSPLLGVAGSAMTGWDIGRALGKTPLLTDPNTTYDQFYQNMFQNMMTRNSRRNAVERE